MEYSIRQLADLAGISTRTLRYYDEVKLLSPSRISPTGYRIYSCGRIMPGVHWKRQSFGKI